MSADVSPENEQYIQTAIENGDYSDRGKALDEAIELLKKRDRLIQDVNHGIELGFRAVPPAIPNRRMPSWHSLQFFPSCDV